MDAAGVATHREEQQQLLQMQRGAGKQPAHAQQWRSQDFAAGYSKYKFFYNVIMQYIEP
jgi:hypothetical protein